MTAIARSADVANPLSAPEQRALEKHEATIERGAKTFVARAANHQDNLRRKRYGCGVRIWAADVLVQRLLLLLARRLAARYGRTLVLETPRALLSSRLFAIEQRIAMSGHLTNRYHVRAKLDSDVAALREQVERLVA